MKLHTSQGRFFPLNFDSNGLNMLLWNSFQLHLHSHLGYSAGMFQALWLVVLPVPGGCFTNVSWPLQNNLANIHNTRNHIYGENFQLKLCMCAQSIVLGTRTKFQLEILIRSMISAIHKFRENILESSRNVSETTPWALGLTTYLQYIGPV